MGGVQQSCHEAEKSAGFKNETDKKVQHGTPHSVQMQGSFWSSAIRVMLACQILLEQVDFIDGQRDDLAVHVGANKNHRAGQVVLSAHLQHLRRVVAEQQRGVGKVQAGIITPQSRAGCREPRPA